MLVAYWEKVYYTGCYEKTRHRRNYFGNARCNRIPYGADCGAVFCVC